MSTELDRSTYLRGGARRPAVRPRLAGIAGRARIHVRSDGRERGSATSTRSQSRARRRCRSRRQGSRIRRARPGFGDDSERSVSRKIQRSHLYLATSVRRSDTHRTARLVRHAPTKLEVKRSKCRCRIPGRPAVSMAPGRESFAPVNSTVRQTAHYLLGADYAPTSRTSPRDGDARQARAVAAAAVEDVDDHGANAGRRGQRVPCTARDRVSSTTDEAGARKRRSSLLELATG